MPPMGVEPIACLVLDKIGLPVAYGDIIAKVGVEPTCPFERHILSVMRIPFRHLAMKYMCFRLKYFISIR